jgi:hypothetical protein
MKHFPKALIQAAALGTDQYGLPQATNLDGLFSDPVAPSRRLLITAAALTVENKARWHLRKSDTSALVPSAGEDRPICGPQTTRLLTLMLGRHYERVLYEFLLTLDEHEQRIPEEMLPMLLSYGQGAKLEVQTAIVQAMGARGTWLGRNASDSWNWLSTNQPDPLGAESSTEQRIAALQNMRKQDPAVAREKLQESWSQEPQHERPDLVACLKVNLSMDDEPFLEGLLDGESEDTRQMVIGLLGQLPESRLCKRMIRRIIPFISLDRYPNSQKMHLEIVEPSELSDSWLRDGVKRYDPWGTQFQYIIGFIAPHYWCARWHLTPAQFVEIVAESRFQFFVDALCVAVLRAKDEEFAGLLIPVGGETLVKYQRGLVDILSPKKKEEMAYHWLQQPNLIFGPGHPAAVILKEHKVRWRPELTRMLLGAISAGVANRKLWDTDPGRSLVETLALYMAPTLKSEILDVLTVPSASDRWQDLVKDVGMLLDFRMHMLSVIRARA